MLCPAPEQNGMEQQERSRQGRTDAFNFYFADDNWGKTAAACRVANMGAALSAMLELVDPICMPDSTCHLPTLHQ